MKWWMKWNEWRKNEILIRQHQLNVLRINLDEIINLRDNFDRNWENWYFKGQSEQR